MPCARPRRGAGAGLRGGKRTNEWTAAADRPEARSTGPGPAGVKDARPCSRRGSRTGATLGSRNGAAAGGWVHALATVRGDAVKRSLIAGLATDAAAGKARLRSGSSSRPRLASAMATAPTAVTGAVATLGNRGGPTCQRQVPISIATGGFAGSGSVPARQARAAGATGRRRVHAGCGNRMRGPKPAAPAVHASALSSGDRAMAPGGAGRISGARDRPARGTGTETLDTARVLKAAGRNALSVGGCPKSAPQGAIGGSDNRASSAHGSAPTRGRNSALGTCTSNAGHRKVAGMGSATAPGNARPRLRSVSGATGKRAAIPTVVVAEIDRSTLPVGKAQAPPFSTAVFAAGRPTVVKARGGACASSGRCSAGVGV